MAVGIDELPRLASFFRLTRRNSAFVDRLNCVFCVVVNLIPRSVQSVAHFRLFLLIRWKLEEKKVLDCFECGGMDSIFFSGMVETYGTVGVQMVFASVCVFVGHPTAFVNPAVGAAIGGFSSS